jgi:plastocyanin
VATGELVVELESEAASPSTASVVYLEPEPSRPGSKSPRRIDITSTGDAFEPPLYAVRSGDTVRFVNRGPLTHRLFVANAEGRRERSLDPDGSSESLRIQREGEHRFYCSLHPDESFTVFASPSEHFLVLGGRRDRIEGVPAGSYRLRWWSDAGLRTLGRVEIAAGETVTRVISVSAASR